MESEAATNIVTEFLRQGPLGLVIVAFLTGWLAPKPTIDEFKKREALKDSIIERQSELIEKLLQDAVLERGRRVTREARERD
jgi:hypothetical protein